MPPGPAAVDTVEAMERLRPYPVSVLCAVTLFIWGNRIWLNWTNPDVDLPAKLALSIPITLFVIASAALLGLLVRGVDRSAATFVRLVRAFAIGTVLFWAVRLPMILVHDHPAAFKVVHAVLAIGSVVAAVFAWRSLERDADGGIARGSGERSSHDALV
ncbi:MAG: hypothetical protein JWM89_234 [Acidimicrobiales bacterium]|nr:hypothetical protein [Acidimicrobiales bacterium]